MEIKYDSLVQKIGAHFTNSKNEVIPAEDIFKIPVLALFFTGSWCPPCEEFSAELVNFYNEANQKEKHFEIIQITNEKSELIYKNSIEKLPWTFIPFGDLIIKDIVEHYKVNYLPFFVIINKEGYVASDTGRKEISDPNFTHKQKIDKWKLVIRSSVEKPIETIN